MNPTLNAEDLKNPPDPIIQVDNDLSRERDRVFRDIQRNENDTSGIQDELLRTENQLTRRNAEFDLGNVELQGAGGQETGTLSREITQNERARAVRTSELANLADNLRDRIRTANEDEDRRLARLGVQYDALQGRVEGQEAQLLEQRRNELEEEKTAQALFEADVASALDSGGATIEEIQALSNTELSKEERRRIAQEVIARTAGEDRDLERRNTQSVIDGRLVNGSFTADGEPIQMPSFEEWAQENYGRIWELGGSEAQMAQLQLEYDDEMEVARRASAMAKLSPRAKDALLNPAGFFERTATEKGEILDELANAGIDTTEVSNGKRKLLSSTQADDFVQAQIARKNVLKLYDMLQSVEGTGPIAGRIRALDPYDPIVTDIKAQINRTVPGLARGIFKEVGVLTDQDVDRYSNTLANLQFTDEQIEQLHNSTMETIDQSISIASKTYHDLGYDMREFSAEEALGGGETTEEDPLGLDI